MLGYLTEQKQQINKSTTSDYFKRIFEDDDNTVCFQCGKKSKQWVDKCHAILLCLNCAAMYRESKWVNVKSISLQIWDERQLQRILRGGNRRFKQFLLQYEIDHMNYSDKLRTKAAEYYRLMLLQEDSGRQPPMLPEAELGRQFLKQQLSLYEMSAVQIAEDVKQKALWLGEQTQRYSKQAYNTIHQKVISGQLKQNSIQVASKIATTANCMWGSIRNKIKQITNKNKQQQ